MPALKEISIDSKLLLLNAIPKNSKIIMDSILNKEKIIGLLHTWKWKKQWNTKQLIQ